MEKPLSPEIIPKEEYNQNKTAVKNDFEHKDYSEKKQDVRNNGRKIQIVKATEKSEITDNNIEKHSRFENTDNNIEKPQKPKIKVTKVTSASFSEFQQGI